MAKGLPIRLDGVLSALVLAGSAEAQSSGPREARPDPQLPALLMQTYEDSEVEKMALARSTQAIVVAYRGTDSKLALPVYRAALSYMTIAKVNSVIFSRRSHAYDSFSVYLDGLKIAGCHIDPENPQLSALNGIHYTASSWAERLYSKKANASRRMIALNRDLDRLYREAGEEDTQKAINNRAEIRTLAAELSTEEKEAAYYRGERIKMARQVRCAEGVE